MGWHRYARKGFSRRSLLRGLGAGAAGLFFGPTIGRLRAETMGATPRQRVVFVLQGNGSAGFSRWDRLTQDEPIITPLEDFATDLPMAPSWAQWRDEVLVTNGLANKHGGGQGAGHRAHYYASTCRPYSGSGAPGGVSIDAYLGQRLGENQVFDVVRLGAEDAGRGLENVSSAAGRNTPLPTQNDPFEAWRELFGVAATGPDERAAFVEKGSLLDGIAADIGQAEAQLSGDEKWKFQRYLHSVETFQTRQVRLLSRESQLMTCAPEPPVMAIDDVGTLFEKQCNLAGAALICGLTEIVVLTVANRNPFAQFESWGFGGGHTIGHGRGETETRPAGQAAQVEIQAELTQRITDHILLPLEQVPEGEGTMRDNTTVIFMNDNAEHHHSKYESWPMYMVGTFGGRIRTGGQRIEFPNRYQPGARSLNQVWNTVCHGMCVPIDNFAVDPAIPENRPGPIPEMML